MRKGPKKTFKGSIYVTMCDNESAKVLLESKDKLKLISTDEFPSLVLTKNEHLAKQAERNRLSKLQKIAKQIPKNSVLKITDIACDSNERFDMKKVRTAFANIHPVEFVDQKEIENQLIMYVRMKGENSVARFMEILDKLKKLESDEKLDALCEIFDGKDKFNKLTMAALEGDEELLYWQKIREAMKAKHDNKLKRDFKSMHFILSNLDFIQTL